MVGASALLAGCATEDSKDEDLRDGTYKVTSVDLGSCSNDTWLKSSTTATDLVVVASGNEFVVKACTDGACSPSSPSTYAWAVDRWRGQDGGAYLVESGCMTTFIDATARVVDGELVIETSRWVNQLASGSCTYDEVLAMTQGPCTGRSRLYATEQ